MSYDEERVVTRREEQIEATPPAGYFATPPVVTTPPVATGASVSDTTVYRRSSPLGTLRRLIIFIFGLIQGLILLRIILLLLAARQGNGLVNAIYDISDVFVAPFVGILRVDRISSGATGLDVAAIVALVGWSILELIILGLVRVFDRPR